MDRWKPNIVRAHNFGGKDREELALSPALRKARDELLEIVRVLVGQHLAAMLDGITRVDALRLAPSRPLGLKHIGFKDVGAGEPMLRRLTAAIREAGASPWMEVVSTSRKDELRSIALARDLGVDWLMGGIHAEEGLRILEESAIRYPPFAGKPRRHPTLLGGTAAEVEALCRAFAAMGCAGVDILAYRALEAEPLDLVAACRRGLPNGGTVVVAGSINSAERVAAVRAAGAFTIGTAAIDPSYAPGAGPLAAQLRAVLEDCRVATL